MSFKWLKNLKNKLWFNIFLQIAAIFAAFLLVLTLSNVSLLSRFFVARQKTSLISQSARLDGVDLNDNTTVSQVLSDISENYNFDVEIYNSRGRILYTTHGSQMMDFFMNGPAEFAMSHEELVPIKSERLSDGAVYEEAVRRFDENEFLLCRREIGLGTYAEVRVQKSLIVSAAKTANEFITVVAAICFALSIVWVLIFARRFSAPLSVMNDITRDMSNLKFDRRIETRRTDEIGELAHSINEMSSSLSQTLTELKQTNERLRDEIELERSLDAMRKGFVANVSHELKTPISIISGYAEGLKLNVNEASREAYCDTIIDESRRMNDLVLGILELSRYESGQMPLDCRNFAVAEGISRIAERVFKDSEITVETNVAADVLVFADPVQTEQVIKAYLENALSHTQKGGKVTVSAETADGRVRITVHNTGSHIEEEKMPQIWQSFYRGDTSHKREKSRFGLGLSIVSAIINMHGTACGVYNTADGVAFWFELKKGETDNETDIISDNSLL